MNNSIVAEKSFKFAVRIIKLYSYLKNEKKEFVLSNQILRCGTSIGANCSESVYAQSTADFLSKLNIALKEAHETDYWLRLLRETEFITEKHFVSLSDDCVELKKILISIIKTTKKNNSI